MSNLNDLYSLAIKLRSKIVSAESCTAGLLAATLTELPGSSVFFEQGYITYSNQYAGNRHFTTMRNNGTPVATWDPGDPDTIINTSCEHIRNFNSWYNAIPQGKLLILQSNNFFKIIIFFCKLI